MQTSDGLIAKVAKYSFDGLHKTALELRDKDVATILPADVTRISIAKQTFAPASTQPVMGAYNPAGRAAKAGRHDHRGAREAAGAHNIPFHASHHDGFHSTRARAVGVDD